MTTKRERKMEKRDGSAALTIFRLAGVRRLRLFDFMDKEGKRGEFGIIGADNRLTADD